MSRKGFPVREAASLLTLFKKILTDIAFNQDNYTINEYSGFDDEKDKVVVCFGGSNVSGYIDMRAKLDYPDVVEYSVTIAKDGTKPISYDDSFKDEAKHVST